MNFKDKYMAQATHQLETKLARLFISQAEARSTAYIYLPKITPLELGNFGQLFIITEIDSDESENKKLLHYCRTK